MNKWMEDFISQCLTDVPPGKYRTRAEKELRDHMETQLQFLSKEEALQVMGDPERLQREYKAAWERSLPARLEELGRCLVTWAVGWAIMLGTHLLISCAVGGICHMALSLPGDSWDPTIRMIRSTLGDLNNSFFWWRAFPFLSALTLGARYLIRRFRASRHPAWKIGVGLSLHGALIAMLRLCVQAAHHHRAMWEEFTHYPVYYLLIIGTCVLFIIGSCVMLVEDDRPKDRGEA